MWILARLAQALSVGSRVGVSDFATTMIKIFAGHQDLLSCRDHNQTGLVKRKEKTIIVRDFIM
jgi:hypothetical protein